jgi:hypothetical protein
VAFYSALVGLNFVNQEVVEKYKAEMRKLEGRAIEDIEAMSIKEICQRIKDRCAGFKSIDVVLYFYPDSYVLREVKKQLAKDFSDKHIVVMVGSDWNHHSYQATFGDTETFFLLLVSDFYNISVDPFKKEMLKSNIDTLKVISKATYLTIQDKAALFALKD